MILIIMYPAFLVTETKLFENTFKSGYLRKSRKRADNENVALF